MDSILQGGQVDNNGPPGGDQPSSSDESDGWSSDDENFAYLVATGIVPGAESLLENGRRRGPRRQNKNRDFDGALRRLNRDYFDESPLYSSQDFLRRFRMSKELFDRIFSVLDGHGIFRRRRDALGRPGIAPRVRMVAALRMLAYGCAADSVDEYLHLSEDAALASLKAFCADLIAAFPEYLRAPSEADLERIMKINASRGFPGCVGSIDCQHWSWQNCPVAWAGQFQGKEKTPTIVLEAIADGDLHIWHMFFGSPGSLNDINILDRSPTIADIIGGKFPPSIEYTVNGKVRTLPYYLADGIYPDWAIFAKTIREGQSEAERAYASAQEAMRKDVERAFGVLLARFHILKRPARLWSRRDISNVMKACVVLHNMIVEERRDSYCGSMSALQFTAEAQEMFAPGTAFVWETMEATEQLHGGALPDGMWASMTASREGRITSPVDHHSLKLDLIAHVWEHRGRTQSDT